MNSHIYLTRQGKISSPGLIQMAKILKMLRNMLLLCSTRQSKNNRLNQIKRESCGR